jgi:hypothetical protein
MNCLYDKNRFCLEAHKVSGFTSKAMKDICINCLSHEQSTLLELFKLKEASWTAEAKIKFVINLWEGGDVNLMDLTDVQKTILIELIKRKYPTFLQTKE